MCPAERDFYRTILTMAVNVRSRIRWLFWRLSIAAVIIAIAIFLIDHVVNLNVARPCMDTERHVIKQYIANMPKDYEDSTKPKAAIHYLIRSNPDEMKELFQSLQLLDKYFNNKFKYPVIMFHENDLTEATKQKLRDSTNSNLIFQNVTLTIPDFIKQPVQKYLYGKSIGYRHMCRFQAMGIYEQPIMKSLDYAWRLDDDSMLRSNIPYDIFRYMADNDIIYGYAQVNFESRRRSRNLWKFVQSYIRNMNITTMHFDQWPIRQQYYNNFEVSATKLWYSKEYQNYVHTVDRAGGIYRHVWGDATIKAIGVSMFVPINKTHYFCDIGYEHESLIKESW